MPSIFELLDRLSFMRGYPAVYMVLATAVFIVMAWDWRLTLFVLAGQYLVAGLLFADTLDPRLAFVKVLTGGFVCLILYMAARQVNSTPWLDSHPPVDVTQEEATAMGWKKGVRIGAYDIPLPFVRLLAALVVLLVAVALAQRPGVLLPALPAEIAHLNVAVYGLIGLGLVGLGMNDEPLRAGLGILVLMTGFELYYSVQEQSIAVLTVLAAVNLMLALAIAYFTQARYALPALADDG